MYVYKFCSFIEYSYMAPLFLTLVKKKNSSTYDNILISSIRRRGGALTMLIWTVLLVLMYPSFLPSHTHLKWITWM